MELLKILFQNGFEAIRLTGGEPLLRKNFFELVSQMRKLPNIKKITLVTNGSIINEHKIEEILMLGFKSVTVSLDSVYPTEFYHLVGVDCLDTVVKNILEMKSRGINLKINSVVSKYNQSHVEELIKFCIKNELPLKILDLVGMEKEYVPLDKIEEYLATRCSKRILQKQDEGFGTPEHVYYIEKTPIVIKNSLLGTCYIKACEKCSKYPCQSGIVSMILTSDGYLKICSLNDELNLDLRPLLKGDRSTFVKLHKMITLYNSAKFSQMWGK